MSVEIKGIMDLCGDIQYLCQKVEDPEIFARELNKINEEFREKINRNQ